MNVAATADTAAQVYALILTGGRSTRMQQDKAALKYHGRNQIEWAASLLQPYATRVFVSVRADQVQDPVRAKFDQIVDAPDANGPIAGILAAQARHPQAAWLVLACDLPFLDDLTLRTLLSARRADRLATAFRSSHDGLPEPLCTLWEPASREALLKHLAAGKSCPRKFLINSDVELIDEPNPAALDNINTPEEYDSALRTLKPAGKRIAVQYYAILREQAGRSDDSVSTSARNPRELYGELQARYGFSLPPDMLRVAVNSEFADWQQSLSDGDSVVFIPPVAGG